MILFVFVIAWAIMGATQETWGDARTGVRGVRTRARASAARRFGAARTHRSAAVRWPAHAAYGTFKTGAGVWHGSRASVRGVRRTGRSFRTGWRAGSARGRAKHAAYVGKRESKREARRAAAPRPHGAEPFPSAESAPEPVRESTATVKPQVRTDDPAEQTPAPDTPASPEPSEPAASAAPVQEGTTMSMPTGEASSYEQAQHTMKEIAAKAQEFVGIVDNLQGELQSNALDAETLGDCADIIDAAQTVQATAEKALNGLETRHSQLHEAIVSAPVDPASTGWYKGAA